MNINEFFVQAYDDESGGGTMVDGIHKMLNLLGRNSSFSRIAPLVEFFKKWVDSGEYARM
ncbi:MAG: hypothetical protein IPK11_15305 [Ignavibacteria bacterium]|nr:hypothetical protein [Ignavibacteria bacterium]